jgi:hypothetical protein
LVSNILVSGKKNAELNCASYSLARKIAANTRGLRRPWIAATIHNGFSSGA